MSWRVVLFVLAFMAIYALVVYELVFVVHFLAVSDLLTLWALVIHSHS